MAQVIRPQTSNNSGMGELLTIGGGALGAAFGGGVPGAVAGAGLGQMAGGMLAPQQPQQQNPQAGGGQAEAMFRRQQQLSQDNLASLKQAEAALPSLPEDLRQQYAPAIVKARMMEQQNRGM